MRVDVRVVMLLLSLPLIALSLAYVQWGMLGLPQIPAATAAATAQGFPGWVRLMHYVNFLFLVLLVRSGLQILADHPRLYWNLHCTPGTEWLRLTPIVIPVDRLWTAKDDARHLSPWIGLPGRRHTVGMARHWHFISVLFWIGNGLLYVGLLLGTGAWNRLIPDTWQVFPDAWSVFVHYATLHMPEENAFVRYNALQQLSYAGVVFVLAPLALITGPSMSPALTARFPWYPRIPGNRQIGRSLHFLIMCAFLAFVCIHVAMIACTGLLRNMNHIALGRDRPDAMGLWIGLGGIASVIAISAGANWLAWRRPRAVQHAAKLLVAPIMRLLFGGAPPVAQFARSDISPFFWVNGRVPTTEEWTGLEAGGFRAYRLRIRGAVRTPVNLSIEDLRAFGLTTQVTLHHCIQGWSGIAEWGGVRLQQVLDHVEPLASATAVVFHSFGDGIAIGRPEITGRYYDSLSLRDARHPQTLLAFEMNGKPLGRFYGAPLRLRVENQLGFKMVKWIHEIEVVEDLRRVRGGEGGFAEDNEYFGELANI
jgi:thiosulfate reductase cytochrome b subunit